MLLLILLFLLLILLSTLLKKRFEQMLPAFACGTTLLLYVLAMGQGLLMAQWVVLAAVIAAAGCLLAQVIKKQGRGLLGSFASNVLTPGLLAFALLCALFFFASRWHVVQHTDDYYYWGIEAHAIFANDGLVSASAHLAPRFMSYTPGMQLFQWLGLNAIGEWSEAQVFFMLFASYAVFTLPLTSRITWKKVYLLPIYLLIAVALPALISSDAYAMLRVDTVLGLCFGYALMEAWMISSSKADSSFHLVSFALSLCMLVLIKQVGIAWALIAVSMLLFVRNPVKRVGVKRLSLLGACAAPILVFGSWLLFTKLNGLSGGQSTSVSALLSGNLTLANGRDQLPSMLLGIFTGTEQSLAIENARSLELPLIAWVLIPTLVPLLLIRFYPEHKKTLKALSLWGIGCFLVCLIGYAFSFLTVFANEWSELQPNSFFLSLTKRYICPYLIGLVVVLLSAASDAIASLKSKTPMRILLAVIAALVLVFTNWASITTELAPKAYAGYAQDNPLYAYEYESEWTYGIDDPEDIIVLYGSESLPYVSERLQYVLAPSKLVILREESITEEEFVSFLQENNITHILCTDEYNTVFENAILYEEYEWLDAYSLYEVQWDGDTPVILY
ncbi:MAG: hypothetical protein GX096_13930 [Clostridiales bacterium]|nr:hypothetical protein [Clostridiales bacterium]